MRKAFTLIELLISIVILSMLMLFLYKSYAGLNKSNAVFFQKVEQVRSLETIKKTLFLDFYTAVNGVITIKKEDKKEDTVSFQTNNSLHQRFAPYVAYLVKEKILYRLESLKPFVQFPLESGSNFVVDALGKVEIFRVYPSKDVKKKLVVVHVLFESKDEIVLKIPNKNF